MRTTIGIVIDEELSLVPRHPKDAQEMFALVERNRTELRAWLMWIDATRTLGDAVRYAQFAQAQFDSHLAFDYAIRRNGELVGSIGLHGIDWGNRRSEIGYWLAPNARGFGVISRAVRALTTHAFTRFDLHRLEIRCVTDNAKSRAVAERLGYAFEGTLAEAYYLHGAFRNIALYSMTVGKWRANG